MPSPDSPSQRLAAQRPEYLQAWRVGGMKIRVTVFPPNSQNDQGTDRASLPGLTLEESSCT